MRFRTLGILALVAFLSGCGSINLTPATKDDYSPIVPVGCGSNANPNASGCAAFGTKLYTFLASEKAGEDTEKGLSNFIYTGVQANACLGTTQASLTHTPVSCIGYNANIRGTETGSITYANNTTTWVAMDACNQSPTGCNQNNLGLPNFTRVAGTHYLTDAIDGPTTVCNSNSAVGPCMASDSQLLMLVTTSGGAITAVRDLRATSLVIASSPNPICVAGVDVGAQISAAIAALPSVGGVIDMNRCVGTDLTLTTPILIDRPVELKVGGNITATTPAPALISSASVSCGVGCIATFNLTGGLPATWLVANKSVAHVLGANVATYNGEWTPISTSNCSGSPSMCTTFTAYINASSPPANLGASGKVIMAPIEVAGATSLNGSGVLATAGSGTKITGIGGGATENGSANIGQAGLAVTGNPSAIILNNSSGSGDLIAVAHWAHDITIQDMSLVGANQFVNDCIVSGAVNNTNRYIHNTCSFPTGTFDGTHFTFGGIVPTGVAFHLDGMINDQGRIEDNGSYGWAQCVFVDAGTTGTAGEIAGPIVDHNWCFYATGAYGYDLEGTSAGHANNNILAQSALAANGSDLLIDGSTGFQSYNVTADWNQFEGDNSLGNTGIVQIRTIGTVTGCEFDNNALTGNTTDSLAAHDPDHNFDISSGTTNCTAKNNTLAHTSAGGIVSSGKVDYHDNLWLGGHATTTLNGNQTFPEATVTVNVPSPAWPVLTTYYLTIPTVSTNGRQVVTCTGHATPTATTFTGCSGGVGTIPDGSAVLEGAAVIPTTGASSLVTNWNTGISASQMIECIATSNSCVSISGDNGTIALQITNDTSNPQTFLNTVPDNSGNFSENVGSANIRQMFPDGHMGLGCANTATLAGGTVTTANQACLVGATAVGVSENNTSGTPAALGWSVNGSGALTIKSSSGADTSVVSWWRLK